MSCRDCVFKGIYHDMGASTEVCNLQPDFLDAIKACEDSANCHHRFTVAEAKKIVIEREGKPIVIQKQEKSNKSKTLNDAFQEVAKSACDAVNAIMKALQASYDESEEIKESDKDNGKTV